MIGVGDRKEMVGVKKHLDDKGSLITIEIGSTYHRMMEMIRK